MHPSTALIARVTSPEIYVPRSVDQVNQIVLAINSVNHRSASRIDRDPSGAFLVIEINTRDFPANSSDIMPAPAIKLSISVVSMIDMGGYSSDSLFAHGCALPL